MTGSALARGLGHVGLLVAALSAVGLEAPAAGQAATPSHVAVVIAGQGSYCAAWHSGMTGADALQAVANVTWGTGPYAGGFVVGINGVVTNPTQRYWSYWHGSGGGWSYSATGVTAYQVSAGGLEGWSISVTNGALTPPPATSYAAVCGGADAPPPSPPPAPAAPTHPAASTPRPAPAPVGPATSAGGGATTRGPASAPTNGAVKGGAGPASGPLASPSGPLAHGSSRTPGSHTPSGKSAAPSSSRASAGALVGGPASAPSGPTPVDARPASRATSESAGSPMPLILGGGLGLLLLAAAGGYAWRRSQSG